MGFEDEAEQSVTRLTVRLTIGPSGHAKLTSFHRPARGHYSTARLELECSPVAVAIDPELLSCRCNWRHGRFPRFVYLFLPPYSPVLFFVLVLEKGI